MLFRDPMFWIIVVIIGQIVAVAASVLSIRERRKIEKLLNTRMKAK